MSFTGIPLNVSKTRVREQLIQLIEIHSSFKTLRHQALRAVRCVIRGRVSQELARQRL